MFRKPTNYSYKNEKFVDNYLSAADTNSKDNINRLVTECSGSHTM